MRPRRPSDPLIVVGAALTFAAFAGGAAAAPVGTAFTYQGRLTEAGAPAIGPYDFEFRLFDDPATGSQVGPTVSRDDLMVASGLFATALDFGAVFDGNARHLQIAVRPGASSGSYTALSERQALSATPYALHATTALSAASVPWGGLTGTPAGFADGVDGDTLAALSPTCTGGQVAKFVGGAWTCADEEPAGSFWSLAGNSGAGHFLGSTDNQPVELRANNARALRLEPHASNPNLVGGHAANSVTAGAGGASIGGGGGTGLGNRVTDDHGTVAGGLNNRAGDNAGTTADHPSAAVGGGNSNTASGAFATVPGGRSNVASGDHSFAAGRSAQAVTHGSFVWNCEDCGTTASTGENQFIVMAVGGVGIGTNTPAANLQLDVAGRAEMDLLEVTAGLGIGTVAPLLGYDLDVAGKSRTEQLQVTNGAAAGRVLTSDASGNATWQPVVGAPCARTCTNSVQSVSYLDASGSCVAAFRIPCFPYKCNASDLCRNACTSSSDCAEGAACDTSKGVCAPVPGSCADAFTVKANDGQIVSCSPYRCELGGCREHCDSDIDCAGSLTCAANRSCV